MVEPTSHSLSHSFSNRSFSPETLSVESLFSYQKAVLLRLSSLGYSLIFSNGILELCRPASPVPSGNGRSLFSPQSSSDTLILTQSLSRLSDLTFQLQLLNINSFADYLRICFLQEYTLSPVNEPTGFPL